MEAGTAPKAAPKAAPKRRTAPKRASKPATTPPAQPQTRTIEQIADELEMKGRELLAAAALARGEKVDRRKKEYRS
jgi:hypothetical protein